MTVYAGLDLLDGSGLRRNQALEVVEGRIGSVGPAPGIAADVDLSQSGTPALVTPGFIDLQVNGGAGLMLANCSGPDDVLRIAAAHQAGGSLAILPTLISDRPDRTARVIDCVAAAARQSDSVLGLHLEGPHLTVPGVHDPAMLRPVSTEDVDLYRAAAARLPHLLITLAPEQVSDTQITALVAAGVHVFLGHSNCTYDAAVAAFDVGAKGVTHLFNAMSGLHHRAPGLVGAALDRAPYIGLIADGHHVHPAALRLAARTRPEALCLVSDAMAVAGTRDTGFDLGGTPIARKDGRLTRADGTLAGADLTLVDAVAALQRAGGLSFDTALKAAFDTPHRALTGEPARIAPGGAARLLHWRGTECLGPLGSG